MAKRDLTGAVDFSVLDAATGGDADIGEEVLGLFVNQAELWRPLLDVQSDGWRDAAHTLRGAAAGIGARDLAHACQTAEDAEAAEAAPLLERIRNALDAALMDVAAWRHELVIAGLR